MIIRKSKYCSNVFHLSYLKVYLFLSYLDVAVFLLPSAISLIDPELINKSFDVEYIKSYDLLLPVLRLKAIIFFLQSWVRGFT